MRFIAVACGAAAAGVIWAAAFVMLLVLVKRPLLPTAAGVLPTLGLLLPALVVVLLAYNPGTKESFRRRLGVDVSPFGPTILNTISPRMRTVALVFAGGFMLFNVDGRTSSPELTAWRRRRPREDPAPGQPEQPW